VSAAEVLSKARDVLADVGWCQKRDGVWQIPLNESPTCISNAVMYAVARDTDRYLDVLPVLTEAIGLPCEVRALTSWNDDPSRTYEDVILALKQAEELAVERGL
jgi:hypothetical protein